MLPASNTLLALLVVSMGLIGVILSFIVPDRKKSLISLVLSGIIVVSGFYHMMSHFVTEYRWNKRMQEIQKESQADLEELRKQMEQKPATNLPAPVDGKSKQ